MRLTIDKFQQLHSISTLEMNDFDKSIKLVQVLLDKTEKEVEKIPLRKFERICKKLEQAFNLNMDEAIKSKPKEIIKANGRRYKLNFEVTKEPFNTGRYIEVATFSDGNTIMNMHNILASIAQPMVFNWNKLKWECLPYNALLHEQYADDLKQADFKHGYHALVFFCQFLMSSIPGSKDYLEIVMNQQTKNQLSKMQLLPTF